MPSHRLRPRSLRVVKLQAALRTRVRAAAASAPRPAPIAGALGAAPMAGAPAAASTSPGADSAPSGATIARAKTAPPRTPDDYFTAIRRLRDEGREAEAIAMLAAFRAAFGDDEQKLPGDLRLVGDAGDAALVGSAVRQLARISRLIGDGSRRGERLAARQPHRPARSRTCATRRTATRRGCIVSEKCVKPCDERREGASSRPRPAQSARATRARRRRRSRPRAGSAARPRRPPPAGARTGSRRRARPPAR